MRVERTSQGTTSLDRLLRALILALAVAVAGFAAYYTWDRRVDPGPSLLDRTTARAEQAVRDAPQNADARMSLGEVYLANYRYTEALAQFNAALEIDDKLLDARRGRGLAYVGLSQFSEAEQEFQAIIDARKDGEFAGMDKMLAEAYYFVGRAQLQLGRPDEAVQSLQSALKIDRTDSDAWQLAGTALLASGKPADAIQAFKNAVLFVPKFVEAYRGLAEAYRARGDEEAARYGDGMVQWSSGMYDEAIKTLQAVTRARPELWEAWTGLGLSYEARLRKQEAAEAFQRALTGNAEDYNARLGLTRLGVSTP